MRALHAAPRAVPSAPQQHQTRLSKSVVYSARQPPCSRSTRLTRSRLTLRCPPAAAAAAGGGFADPDRDISWQQTRTRHPEDAGEAHENLTLSSGEFDEATGEKLGNASNKQALFNVLNILLGVGLLSIPCAFKQAGWAGLAILWLLALITNLTGKLLIECYEEVAEQKRVQDGAAIKSKVTYEQIGAAAFGTAGRAIISAVMYTELLGTCALLFILEGDNLFQLLGSRFAPDARTYMLLAAGVMVPTVWLPNLKALSYLGFVGVAATVSVALTVAYTLLTGNFTPGASTVVAKWSTMPMVFGILCFVYAGHGVFPTIRASMRKPEDFPKVLDRAYFLIAVLCTFIGCAGYYMYGAGALDVVTFNLPRGLLATLCASLILVNPIAKFALNLDPVAAAATAAIGNVTGGMPVMLRRVLVRTSVAVATLAAARFIPFLSILMALVGSLLTVAVTIIFPAACHLQIFKGRLSARQRVVDWGLVLVGVLCALSGTSASLRALAAKTALA